MALISCILSGPLAGIGVWEGYAICETGGEGGGFSRHS